MRQDAFVRRPSGAEVKVRDGPACLGRTPGPRVGEPSATPPRSRRLSMPALTMLADDFAPHLSPTELAALASSVAATRPVVVMSAMPSRLDELRVRIDPRRVDVMLRELVVLVRRSLRGTDAVALAGDELLVMVDGPMLVAAPIPARL